MGKIYFDVYVVKLTYENIPQIIEKTSPLGWTLQNILKDNMEYNAEEGNDTLLFMKLFREDPTQIATFLDEEEDPQNPSLRLTEETDPLFGIFHKFEIL